MSKNGVWKWRFLSIPPENGTHRHGADFLAVAGSAGRMTAGSVRALSSTQRFFAYWLPVIGYCLGIFIQSSFPSPDVLPPMPYMDKLLHVAGFGLLGALFFRALRQRAGLAGRPGWLLLLSVTLATLYGASDEWHQSFVAARSAEFADLWSDLFGSVIGAVGYRALIAKSGGLCGRYSLIDKILHFL
jgi:hypothetical protein